MVVVPFLLLGMVLGPIYYALSQRKEIERQIEYLNSEMIRKERAKSLDSKISARVTKNLFKNFTNVSELLPIFGIFWWDFLMNFYNSKFRGRQSDRAATDKQHYYKENL